MASSQQRLMQKEGGRLESHLRRRAVMTVCETAQRALCKRHLGARRAKKNSTAQERRAKRLSPKRQVCRLVRVSLLSDSTAFCFFASSFARSRIPARFFASSWTFLSFSGTYFEP